MTESERSLKYWLFLKCALVIAKRVVRSNVGQSVKTVDGFVNDVKLQLDEPILHGIRKRVFWLSNGFSVNIVSWFCCAVSLYWRKSPFFLVGKVALLLLRIFRRLFLRTSRLLLQKSFVVVSRKPADNYIRCVKHGIICHGVNSFSLSNAFVVLSVESHSVSLIFVFVASVIVVFRLLVNFVWSPLIVRYRLDGGRGGNACAHVKRSHMCWSSMCIFKNTWWCYMSVGSNCISSCQSFLRICSSVFLTSRASPSGSHGLGWFVVYSSDGTVRLSRFCAREVP